MKTHVLLFIVLLIALGQRANAQLKAHAGADSVMCSFGTSPKTPHVGGSPAATGGVMPYTYEWIFMDDPSATSNYMDDVNSPYPQLKNLVQDSTIFILKVTDNTSAVAYDTVKIYKSRWTLILGDCIKFKNAADTVSISGQATGNFPPFKYQWSPATQLSNDKVASPRSWATTTTTYTVQQTDDKGCVVAGGQCSVVVNPTSILPLKKGSNQVIIYPQPVNETSVIAVSDDMIGGRLSIYSLDGKLVYNEITTKAVTPITRLSSITAGVLMYRYDKAGHEPVTGKLIVP